mgnify:CR=1 FL=1
MIAIKTIKLIISFFCFVFLIFNNTNLTKDNNLDISVNKKKKETNYANIIDNLKEQYNNKDIVGILKISSNNFEIPIVQGKDNEYYLNHTINNKKSNLGSVFLDYRVSIYESKKLLIYGHSSSKINIDFNILENYYDKEYYMSNKYISLITSNEERIYEIFSVYIETLDFSYMTINFIDNNDFYRHIQDLKNKSLYVIDTKLEQDDEILILQTCSNDINYTDYDKKYLLIISRRIR